MNEMIEKVAKAIYAVSEADADWSEETEQSKDLVRDEARAAIAAMRRPLSQQLGEAAAAHGGDRVFWSSLLGDIISDALSEKT